MKVTRRTWDGEDAAALAAALRAAVPADGRIAAQVAETLAAVRAGGDAALLELGERFDSVAVERPALDPDRLAGAPSRIEPDLRTALELAATNIRAVAEAQVDADPRTVTGSQGQVVTVRQVPVGSAAIYAPGGRAAYPSSVLMGAIPARVAGVRRVVVASPPGPDGAPAGEVLAAAAIAGVDEVCAAGGAQAIAALAYGTESIEPVDVIAGPGNPWVQEAKLQVSRTVGIDGYAGPSELVVVADGPVSAAELALDLAAQAEHGADGLLAAICTAPETADILESELEAIAERAELPAAPVSVIEAPDLRAAIRLCQAVAPEHLELACADAVELAPSVTTAGCVFVGAGGGTAFGDYAAGSNHILPTGGAGRYTGPLGPSTFRRPISLVEIDRAAASILAGPVDVIARAEGFPLHGESARARAKGPAEPAS
jgi:histidinol dehydrogenase